jgi:hypothetical protein
MWIQLATWKKTLAVLFAILGILALAAGVLYMALPAHSLPTFFPAYSHTSKHGTKHGIAALVLGVIFLGIAVLIPVVDSRSLEGARR